MNKMKVVKIISTFLAVVALCTGCDLTLLPENTVAPEKYFKTETDLQLWTNGFYRLFDSPDSQAGLNADDYVDKTMGEVISGTRLASDKANGTNEWNWKRLRDINYYLQHSNQCENESIRAKYDGVAYFFRAYFYFQKVIRYGDVPWYDQVLNSTDDELLAKPREDRGLIMDHIISDLNLAIAQLPATKDLGRVTKWTALALKSRVALYEGTWRQYRGLPDAEKYLTEAANAGKQFIEESGYKLYSTGKEPYRDMFCSDNAKSEEVILARIYNFAGLGISHSVQFNIRNANTGFTKRFMNHYLMADGTRFTDVAGHETMTYAQESQNRDPRMSQTVLCPGYIAKEETSKTVNDMNSMTGYEPIKFVASAEFSGASKGTSDWSLFRAAEVYLNYAEAMAELGTISQADLDMSINVIRKRAQMPNLELTVANANPDPYMASCYPNVKDGANKGVILEIRRERTVELVMEGFRMWDMFRWKEGAQMVNKENPYYGMYFPTIGLIDLDGDGKNDLEIYETTQVSKPSDGLKVLKLNQDIKLSEGNKGYVVAWPDLIYEWNEERDYLWPIPASQRVLTNGMLTQNPGWTDSTNFD